MDKTKLISKAELIDVQDVKDEFREFQKWALKKNMIELAIAFILGASFQKVVTAISQNFFMPIINGILLHTGIGWREATWEIAPNISIEIGELAGAFVDFTITAAILYLIFVRLRTFFWPTEDGKKNQGTVPLSLGP